MAARKRARKSGGADSQFYSSENARIALLTDVPGSRKARQPKELEHLLTAARRGVFLAYKKLIEKEANDWFDYAQRIIDTIKPPRFSVPPLKPTTDEEFSMEREMADWSRIAKGQYDSFFAVATARRVIAKTYGDETLKALFQDADAVPVVMGAYILFECHQRGYREPQPVELALIAVAIGLEPPITPPERRGESEGAGDDSAANRSARWRHRLEKAREYARQRAM